MSIFIDIKEGIKDGIRSIDESVIMVYEEMSETLYPYVFFYLSNFTMGNSGKLDWNKVNLSCVLEYKNEENSTNADLMAFQDTFQRGLVPAFTYGDIAGGGALITPMNITYEIVEGVLQMTFDLEFYVKDEDTRELMQELEFSIKIGD